MYYYFGIGNGQPREPALCQWCIGTVELGVVCCLCRSSAISSAASVHACVMNTRRTDHPPAQSDVALSRAVLRQNIWGGHVIIQIAEHGPWTLKNFVGIELLKGYATLRHYSMQGHSQPRRGEASPTFRKEHCLSSGWVVEIEQRAPPSLLFPTFCLPFPFSSVFPFPFPPLEVGCLKSS